jgi:cytochrome c556
MRGTYPVAAAAVLFVMAACSSSKPAPAAQTGPAFRLTGTIKEIMDSVVDPSADVLWDSVSTTINREGTTEKQPRTDEEWKSVRRSAVALVEATNLLVIEGRRMAPEGDKSENPDIELAPEQMQKLMDADRGAWVKNAHGLHDAAMVALQAIDKKDVKGLMDAGETIDAACENCHKQYWYPDQKPS